jgi:sarcosine oxidase subunit alpha
MSARLPKIAGEWIDRSTPIDFKFETEHYEGFAGDTVTSALCAARVSVLGRSFKYHRQRGVLSMANHDVNALFQDGGRPNLRGDVALLRKGMRLTAVNTFGGIKHDRARILDRLSALFPVGFYYRPSTRRNRCFRSGSAFSAASPGWANSTSRCSACARRSATISATCW